MAEPAGERLLPHMEGPGMSIETYGQLREAMADWLNREDLVDRIPTFIAFGEARINRMLRVKPMIVRARAYLTEAFVPYPKDWIKAKNLQRLSDGKPLGMMTLEEIDEYRRAVTYGGLVATDGPEYFAEQGTALEVAPAPTPAAPAELEMTYYARIPALKEQADSNWLLRLNPDVYLYNSLIHSAPFLKEDERTAVWQQMADRTILEMNEADADSRYSGAPMVRRVNSNW